MSTVMSYATLPKQSWWCFQIGLDQYAVLNRFTKKLDDAVAIALVLFQVLQRQPGSFYYRHQTWDPSALSRRHLVMVEIFSANFF
jgi:hypothetical protein